MTVHNVKMIYLGNFADVDTDESNTNSENAADLLGVYSDLSIPDIQVNDTNSNNTINDDDNGATTESSDYDVGNGPQSQFVDSTLGYNATLLLGDGSTVSMLVVVIQMQNGDTFVNEWGNNGSLDGLSIQSVTLDSVYGSDYIGYFVPSSIDNTEVVCFTRGTQIMTPDGPVPVERLRIGQNVVTLDHGPQALRWVGGQRHVNLGRNAPVRIAEDALGPRMPARALCVSPQHRILLRNAVARRMFGHTEVLVAAKSLLGMPGITQSQHASSTTYWHFACDNHEMVMANGTWAETLLLGPVALKALPIAQRRELAELLPAAHPTPANTPAPCRPCPPMRRQLKLVDRLARNASQAVVAPSEPRR